MAFKQVRGGGRYDPEHREYACDTESDLDSILEAYKVLPIGTIARVIETGDIYVLNGDDEWIKQTKGGGSGGGSSLPEVTSEDNGDVLTVVSGAWAKAAPSGGSDMPAVTSDDNGDVLTVVNGAWDKSVPSIYAVHGDYANEDVLPPEELDMIYKVMDTGGLVFITTTYNGFTIFAGAIGGFFSIYDPQVTLDIDSDGVISIND